MNPCFIFDNFLKYIRWQLACHCPCCGRKEINTFRIDKKDIEGTAGGALAFICTFDSEWVVFHFKHHLIYKAL